MTDLRGPWAFNDHLDHVRTAPAEGRPHGAVVASIGNHRGFIERAVIGPLIAAAPDLLIDGEFLADRLQELDGASASPEEFVREFYGHVAPALARFRAATVRARGDA